MSWLAAVTAAPPPTRSVTPQTPYVPNAPQTLPTTPAATPAPAKAGKAANPAAAGTPGQFNAWQHLRGSDGRFITKGAIVNVTGADGKPKRGRVTSLGPDGPVITYDDGTQETIPVADVTTRVSAAPVPVARIIPASKVSEVVLPRDQAIAFNNRRNDALGQFDKNSNCQQDAAQVLKTGQPQPGGCAGDPNSPTVKFLQQMHAQGAQALTSKGVSAADFALAVQAAKVLGINTAARTPQAPPAPKKPKAAKKAPKAKKVAWSAWG